MLDYAPSDPSGRTTHLPSTQGVPTQDTGGAFLESLPSVSMSKPSHDSAAASGASESGLKHREVPAPANIHKEREHDNIAEGSREHKGKGKADEKGMLSERGQGSGTTADALPVYEP